MPILKQLVSGAHAKRRSRVDLTREMISAPLGDFRHTMHVGRSGDAFGDTSFLASRSGGPPESASYPSSPRPGLLARTFRSSKRSQSVTRVDQPPALASAGSAPYVKNAVSLPFLGAGEQRGDGSASPGSAPSPCEADGGPGEDAASGAHPLELWERSFGELPELPESSAHPQRRGGGMKHAESVLSFHVDLGPSMLGDILGVMEKEDDDLGYEEGKSNEGQGEEEEEGEEQGEEEQGGAAETAQLQLRGGSARLDISPAQPGHEEEEEEKEDEEDEEELRPGQHPLLLDDSCSVSSSGSVPPPASGQAYAGDTDSATFSAPPPEEEEQQREEDVSHFSSFLEDQDDEIRV